MKTTLLTHAIVLMVGLAIGHLTTKENREKPIGETSQLPSQVHAKVGSTPPADTSDLTEDSLKQSVKTLTRRTSPALREAELAMLGLRAAEFDIELARETLASIEDPYDKAAFMRGVVTHIARTLPVNEAINYVRSIDPALETAGYRVLASEWSGEHVYANSNVDHMARILMGSKTVSDEIKDGWLKAFKEHPMRGSMLAGRALNLLQDDPSAAFALGDHLTDWERGRFMNQLTASWAWIDADAAWQWAQSNPDQATATAVGNILAGMFQKDEEAALATFERMTESEDRIETATRLAEMKANHHGTRAAIEWADSLPNPSEQDAAHAQIYKQTPRGIGAVLSTTDAGVKVMNVLPDTPAASAGLRGGDRIVEIDSGDGNLQNVSGMDLKQAIGLIRGEAGSPLQLRILRDNPNGGFTEHLLDINRQQLEFEGQAPQTGFPLIEIIE